MVSVLFFSLFKVVSQTPISLPLDVKKAGMHKPRGKESFK